ncbi:ATP-binding cassette domain-containing protein [Dokdonella sp.]|uniref:ATP-binding cassette domain-containing protein n=1 Tax=Dokdonella sp. TaxID=2291710 RepID=UPI003C489BEE
MIEVRLGHDFPELRIDVEFAGRTRCLALFGDSGAGKTTILDAIAGLLEVQTGRIVLDEHVVLDRALGIDVPPSERGTGYVFQDGRLFPHLSVRDNLLYGARSRRQHAGQFDHLVELLDLGPLLQRQPPTLSGGERQRVAIGRALVAEPRVLLLDEPLTGLHREARLQVLEHLRQLKHQLSVATVLVSHQADEVCALADEVVLVQAGTVRAQLDVEVFAATHLPSMAKFC